MSNLQREIASRYLEEKGIKQLLQRVVISLLEARPENPPQYIIEFLSRESEAKDSATQELASQGPVIKEPVTTKEPVPKASLTQEPVVQELVPKEPIPSACQSVSSRPSVSASPQSKTEDVERWPSMLNRPHESIVTSKIPGTPTEYRRASYVSRSVLSLQGSLTRRLGMSSKMTSSTAVEIRVVPKDPQTFAQLIETVKKIDLFAFLQAEPRRQLVNAMFPINFTNEQVIIKQGAPPDNFYVLNSGNCKVLKRTGDEEKQVALLHPGQYFGELALISGRARSATVIAVGDVNCWAIDQTTYLGLLKEHHVQKRQRYQSLLRNLPALKALPDYEILLVADALQEVNPADGEEIMKQGDSGNEFFIILEGQCRVLKKEEGATEAQQVALLENGSYFGELALMRDTPRAATVIAGPHCKLIKLDRQSFLRLLGPCYDIFREHMKSYETTA